MLLVRDPSSLYVHWALPEAPAPTSDRSWALRLYDLTTLNPAAAVEYACPSGLRAGQLTDLSPERRYRAELGAYDHAERWQPRLRSNAVQTPPATPTAWVEDRFVTIPWEVDLSGYAPPLLTPPATPAAGAPLPAGARRAGLLVRKPLPGMVGLADPGLASGADAPDDPSPTLGRPAAGSPATAGSPAAAGVPAAADAPAAGALNAGLTRGLGARRRPELRPLPSFAPLGEPLAGGSSASVLPPTAGDGPGG